MSRKKSIRKDLVREVRKSFGRFFAILAIVLIGVAFFAGVCASPIDMRATADSYFDKNALCDIRLVSSIGFNEEDLNAIRANDKLVGIYGAHTLDVLVRKDINENEAVAALSSIPVDLSENNVNYLNRFRIFDGRLPEKENECVVRVSTARSQPLSVGDKLYLSSGTAEELSENLAVSELTIVGIVYVPTSISFSLGNSSIGNGNVSYLIWLPETAFKSEYYTNVYVTVDDAASYDTFTDAYFEQVAPVKAALEELAVTRLAARTEDMKMQIADAVTEEVTNEVTKQVTEEVEKAVREAIEETVRAEVEASVLEAVEAETLAAVWQALRATGLPDEYLTPMVEEEYAKALTKAMEGYDTLVEATYPDVLEEVMQEEFQKTVDEKAAEEIGKILPDKIEEVSAEQIEEKLKGSENWKWYVLDRNSQESYVQYRDAADQMVKISSIFPVFFLFVAALVCFTTMTRMVAEQRQLIGTYKALGYGKISIAMRYIIYAFTASLIGGVVGCIAGLQVFPTVIFNAWGIAYQMPKMVHADNLLLCIVSVVSITIVVVLAALFACISELREVPSELMRPKAPKIGRKIFLEKITFIWKRVSFTRKVTIRNIFRYKKRFFMTLAGVAGCTGLLVTGFGISDSISGLVTTQYEEIFKYDATVTLKNDITDGEVEQALKLVKARDEFREVLQVSATSGISEDIDTTIMVVRDTERFGDFFELRRVDGKKDVVTIPDDAVVVSQRTAEMLELREGDTYTLENRDGVRKEVKVGPVIEFYVGHYAYMTADYYEKIFGEAAPENTILGITGKQTQSEEVKQLSDEQRDAVSEALMDDENITGVSFFSVSVKTINSMISALKIITVVLIISSGLLAFVVLYNLSNVNISERLREIATIKVLGFYDPEVNAYVYRETIAITIVGALVGIPVGIGLHHMIMGTIAMEAVTFGNYIAPISYLYSVILTVIFALIVSAFINIKLKKIPMVESLKSVE